MGLFILILFYAWHHRHSRPLMPVKILTIKILLQHFFKSLICSRNLTLYAIETQIIAVDKGCVDDNRLIFAIFH